MEKSNNQRLKAIEDRLEKIERQLQNGYFQDFEILTIHHLSATGGPLISKCLAAMPNVVLLSETNPTARPNVFDPFDPIQQLQKYNFLSDEDYQNIFLDRIAFIVDKCIENQKKLIIRDHSHSDFLRRQVTNPPSLLNTISEKYKVKPLITLRNPIDSWLSIGIKGWDRGVETFDNYCNRYLKFLDAYSSDPYYLYEDFLEQPDRILSSICEYYGIDFDEDYKKNFFKIKLTGDSGRTSPEITPRPRRDYSEEFAQEVRNSKNFAEICNRLGYEGIKTKEQQIHF